MSNIDKVNVGGTEYDIKDANTAKIVCNNVESGNTASKTYTNGNLIRIDDVLYRVTSPIAIGEVITEGVNVVETNIGDELSRFYSYKYGNAFTFYSGFSGSVVFSGNALVLYVVLDITVNNNITNWQDIGEFSESNSEILKNYDGGYYTSTDGTFTIYKDNGVSKLRCQNTTSGLHRLSIILVRNN